MTGSVYCQQGMFAFDIIDHMGGGPMGLSTPEWLEKSINEGIVARFPFLWWVINLVWACVFIFIMLRVMRHLADYTTGQPPWRVCLFFPC